MRRHSAWTTRVSDTRTSTSVGIAAVSWQRRPTRLPSPRPRPGSNVRVPTLRPEERTSPRYWPHQTPWSRADSEPLRRPTDPTARYDSAAAYSAAGAQGYPLARTFLTGRAYTQAPTTRAGVAGREGLASWCAFQTSSQHDGSNG